MRLEQANIMKNDKFTDELNSLEENSCLRSVKNIEKKEGKYIWVGGKKLLNLSSNNYLGFADNEEVTKRFLAEVGHKYSFGSSSARLLTGNLPIYEELETLITSLFNHSAIQSFNRSTLLLNSGYHANVAVVSALAGAGDVVFSDKLNHASIIDGMQLAKGRFFRYKHNDAKNLEQLLNRERDNFKNAIIISESVFSMDGDIADLAKLVELKEKYNCILVVDEAHAFGVFGDKGLGVAEKLGLIGEIDLIMGTFGKAIGSMGAFVTGKKVLIDYLVNKARPFIFSTALPPINVAFSKWIIENELPKTQPKREQMLTLASRLANFPCPCGTSPLVKVGAAQSHIVPVIIGDNAQTSELCTRLLDNGYFTLPIRPPTVPEGTSRLRLSLTTDITEADLEVLCSIIG